MITLLYTLLHLTKSWWESRHLHHWITDTAPVPTNEWLKMNFPVIVQPTIDVDHQNELLAVFITMTQTINLLRSLCGQGIHIRHLNYDGSSWLTIFTPDYCKTQVWNKGDRKNFRSEFQEYSTIIPRSAWEFYPNTSRPMLFVNTWNHLHGPINLNPDLQMTTWTTYPVYVGNAEQFIKTVIIQKKAGRTLLQSKCIPLRIWD